MSSFDQSQPIGAPLDCSDALVHSHPKDITEVLEEAGINPIDVYEHPCMPVPWRIPETAQRGNR
jgi:hypothetical protein